MLSLAGLAVGASLADMAVFHDWNTASIEAPPRSAGGGAYRSETWQMLANARDEFVEAACVLRIDATTVEALAFT